MQPSPVHVQFPIFAMMTSIQPRQILIPASMLPVALHASLMFIHFRVARGVYLRPHVAGGMGASTARLRLARRYVLADIVGATVVEALLPFRTLDLAVLELVLAYVLFQLVSGLNIKDYKCGAVVTYFLAVFKAVDVALLA